MGGSESQPEAGREEGLAEFSLAQYGGTVLVDKVNRLVYKDFVIGEHEREEF